MVLDMHDVMSLALSLASAAKDIPCRAMYHALVAMTFFQSDIPSKHSHHARTVSRALLTCG